MKLKVLAIALLGAGFAIPAGANIILTGDYVKVQINNNGTIGNGSTPPGLIFDPTGTGTFIPSTDYVQPGTPFEGFGVQFGTTGVFGNRNQDFGGNVTQVGSLVDQSAGALHKVVWTGEVARMFSIQHTFFFNDTDQRVNISTTLTALSNLSNVRVSRAVDPDPDNFPGGSAATQNFRGIDNNADGDALDPGDVAAENFVGSVGTISGRPLGLYSNQAITHNTGIVGPCCSVIDPDEYLDGGDFASSLGDNGIGIAFALGDVASGASVTLNYAYVMGGSLATIDIPPDPDPGTNVPEPATLLLTGLGLLGMGAFRRRIAR